LLFLDEKMKKAVS